MKTLTVCQPWAWLIVAGIKRIENRTWRTKYRGPLAIHAGKSRKWITPGYFHMRDNYDLPAAAELAFGAVLGVVELVDVVSIDDPKMQRQCFAEGPWCWVLGDARAIEPIVCNGKQLLWEMEIGEGIEGSRVARLEPGQAKPE